MVCAACRIYKEDTPTYIRRFDRGNCSYCCTAMLLLRYRIANDVNLVNVNSLTANSLTETLVLLVHCMVAKCVHLLNANISFDRG